MNYNVALSLWWTVMENVSGSIRSGDALSAFIYLTTDSNAAVGVLQGINGIMQLVVALPAGWLADRTRRDMVMRIGAGVGFCGLAALVFAMESVSSSAWPIGVAMGLLGTYRGFYNPALEALFADSVETGRTSPYTWRYVLMISSSGMGPLFSAAAFLYLGSSSWTATDCRVVVLFGACLMIPALLLMCFFDDDKALSHRSEAVTEPLLDGRASSERDAACDDHDNDNDDAMADDDTVRVLGGDAERQQDGVSVDGGMEPCLPSKGAGNVPNGDGNDWMSTGDGAEEVTALLSAPSNEEPSETALVVNDTPKNIACPRGLCWISARIAVPVLLTLSDFIGALASGMTLRFFSLFFMQRVGFAPIAVSLLSAASPMGVSAASLVAQKAAKRIGRVQLSLLTRTADIALLILLARLPVGPGSNRKAALIAVHLIRMASANCTRPLLRSVLNEFVAKRHRGRVNAIDSIRTFSWSGSAALGGFLIQKYGFETTFLITAAVKACAVVPLAFLLRYVPDGIGAYHGRAAASHRAIR